MENGMWRHPGRLLPMFCLSPAFRFLATAPRIVGIPFNIASASSPSPLLLRSTNSLTWIQFHRTLAYKAGRQTRPEAGSLDIFVTWRTDKYDIFVCFISTSSKYAYPLADRFEEYLRRPRIHVRSETQPASDVQAQGSKRVNTRLLESMLWEESDWQRRRVLRGSTALRNLTNRRVEAPSVTNIGYQDIQARSEA